MPRKVMMSPGQSKKETRESAAAKEKAKANMYLTGGQAKLDKNKNNKIDAQDFKILRAEKAKGRGQGLQDESVKPGKVMKAKRGTGVLTEKGTSKTFSGYSKPFEGPQVKGKVSTIVGVKPRAKIIGQRKKFKTLEEMRKAKGFKIIDGKQETAQQFNKRKAAEAFAKKAAKATGARGKIALGIAAAGVGAVQYLKSKMKKKQEESKKKMGGGMMKKYRSGGSVPVEKIKKAFPEANPSRVAKIQTMLGDKSAPMKKERLFEGDRGRRKELIKKLTGVAKTTPLGLGIKVGEAAKKIKEKVKSRAEGGPAARAMGRAKKLTASDMRDAQLKEKKYDKFFAGQESEFSQKIRAAKKLEKQMQKASPMAQSRLRERGSALFGRKASDDRMKASFRDTAKTLMGGGMMNKPMGYKSGTSVKVKCKLGRNKPTKMY